MKVSEIDLPTLKQYLRVDGDEDNILLTAYLDSAKEYMTSYLGCTISDLDKYARSRLWLWRLLRTRMRYVNLQVPQSQKIR